MDATDTIAAEIAHDLDAALNPPPGPAPADAEWAIVEIMGHRKLYGRVHEEERFGTKMLRIDIPKPPRPPHPEPVEGPHAEVLAAGEPRSTHDAAVEWITQWYSGPSIFSITLTDEATVMRANAPYAPPQRYLPRRDNLDDDEVEF